MSNTIYIHYGSRRFDSDRFEQPKNREYHNKPEGGFWASPVDAEYGWKQWNDDSQFIECDEDNSFKFTLKDGAKVFHIYSKDDIDKLPLQKGTESNKIYLFPDFEKMVDDEYDAIEYHLSEQKPHKEWTDGIYHLLYGWDCDSILILNKDVIESVDL